MKIKSYTDVHSIIDRDDDIRQLINHLRNAVISQVHIVYAKTGYGKSSFSTKLTLDKFFSNWEVIRVVTMPRNYTTNVQEGEYLELVFSTMHKHFLSEGNGTLSFEHYISNGNNKMIEKMALNTAIDTMTDAKFIEKPLPKLFALLVKRWLKTGTYDPYAIINNYSPISRSIKADYIRHVLEKARIFLIIENIQNIDNTSYKYLLDWINDTKDKKHGFLLEYTVSDKSSIEKMKIFRHTFSKTGAELFEAELEKLPEEYIAEVIESQLKDHPSDIHFTIEAQKHYKQYSNGNLWDLIDYASAYEETEEESELQTPTLSILRNLSDEAQYIISILIFHDGSLNKATFEYIWRNYFSNRPQSDLETLYLELYKTCSINDLQTERDEKISISHASIVDVWQTNSSNFSAIDRDVSRRLTSFYNENYYGSLIVVGKVYAWQMLIRIYAVYEPEKIMELLDDFKSNLMKTISRQNTSIYLELLIKHTKMNITELQDIYFKMLKIYRSASLYEEGYSCIELMEHYIDIWQNDELLLNKLSYLSILDKHDAVIELYKIALKNIEKHSSTWIKLKLLVLNSFIALGDKNSCLSIDRELTRMRKFKLHPEYAIYLRLTNIYKKPSQAVYDAKKSIKLFRKKKEWKQEGKSYITYSKLLSSLGKHQKAIKMIKIAEELLSEYNEGMSCIYNNLASYLLLSGNHGKEVWDYLDIAEIYSVSTYDKLSVVLNKLAWCYENNSFIRLDLLENKALELIKLEPTLLIHCTTYYNLYVVMEKAGIKSKADKYYLCAEKLKDKCSFVRARIDGVTHDTRYLKPRLKKPYHICYLSFWLFDL